MSVAIFVSIDNTQTISRISWRFKEAQSASRVWDTTTGGMILSCWSDDATERPEEVDPPFTEQVLDLMSFASL